MFYSSFPERCMLSPSGGVTPCMQSSREPYHVEKPIPHFTYWFPRVNPNPNVFHATHHYSTFIVGEFPLLPTRITNEHDIKYYATQDNKNFVEELIISNMIGMVGGGGK
jgi:hypothetical protein